MAEKLKCLDLSENLFQLKKQMLESGTFGLQNSQSLRRQKGASGAQVTAAPAPPEAWAREALLMALWPNGVASSLDPPAEGISNGLLPDLTPKSREN